MSLRSLLQSYGPLFLGDPICRIVETTDGGMVVTVQKCQLFWALLSLIAAPLLPALSKETGLTLAMSALTVAVEILLLYLLVGRDQVTISMNEIQLRRTILGVGFSRRFDLCTIRKFGYIDIETFDSPLKYLYFESDYRQYLFAKGINAEAATAVTDAIGRVAPRLF